jgi:tetrachlorobenzoquinone reductase
VRVHAARWEAEGVASYELVPVDGGELAAWTPGAHIDVHLPSGTIRQYSLCGDPTDLGSYRIGVLELPYGRGGSVEVHRELRPGVRIRISEPRSNFGLVDASRYLFVAGGIGITPLLPMIRQVARAGAPWELVYGARTSEHFAFAAELGGYGERVRFVAQDVDGLPDLSRLLDAADGVEVFCCGPVSLMDALAAEMSRAGAADHLHIERFSPAPESSSGAAGFEVELARSGRVIQVGADVTVLDAVRSAGVDAPSSCEMGICGTCETKVLSGVVDHRDELLTDAEKAQGSVMMICVSRAQCPRLVLDL